MIAAPYAPHRANVGGLSDRLIRRVIALHQITDLGVILACGLAAWLLRFGTFQMPGHYFIAGLLIFGLTAVSLPLLGAYRHLEAHRYWKAMAQTLLAWSIAVLLSASIAYLSKTAEMFSRLWIGYWWALGIIFLPAARYALAKYSRRISQSDRYTENAILIGNQADLNRLLRLFSQDSLLGINATVIWARDHDTPANPEDRFEAQKEIQNLGELEKLLDPLARNPGERQHIDQVWLVGDISDPHELGRIIDLATRSAARVIFAPSLPLAYEHPWAQAHNIAGVPVIDLAPAPSRLSATSKRIFDLAVAIPALILLAPLFAIIAIAIKLDSKGPVFYRQERLTKHGRVFSCIKFRTMHHSSEEERFQQASRGDSRITGVGRTLRRYSLDELPQLINVVVGEMSIVGPRPHPLDLDRQFRPKIPGFMYRSLVKSGMTGLAQISGLRGETTDPEKMVQRVRKDIEYINNWSPLLDLKILLKTIPALFRNEAAF